MPISAAAGAPALRRCNTDSLLYMAPPGASERETAAEASTPTAAQRPTPYSSFAIDGALRCPETFFHLGQSHRRAGNLAAADEHFVQGMAAVNWLFGWTHFCQARWLDNQGDEAAALESCAKAAKLLPGCDDVQHAWAHLLMRKSRRLEDAGDLEAARATCLEARCRGPLTASMRLQGSKLLVKMARFAEAIDLLERYVGRHPEQLECRLSLARAFVGAQRLEQANRMLNRMLPGLRSRRPALYPQVQATRTEVLSQLGHFVPCIRLLSQLITEGYEVPEMTLRRAVACENHGSDSSLEGWRKSCYYSQAARDYRAVIDQYDCHNAVAAAGIGRTRSLAQQTCEAAPWRPGSAP